MTLQSIEKLREIAADINASEIVDHMELYPSCVFDGAWLDAWHAEFNRIIDRLEAEIAERFMELPVDADGVPIHVGDELETAHGGKVIVEYVGECEVGVYRDGEHYRISQDEYAYTCRHVKPRTVEDVLVDMLETAVGYSDAHTTVALGAVERYADEIRELLEVSE